MYANVPAATFAVCCKVVGWVTPLIITWPPRVPIPPSPSAIDSSPLWFTCTIHLKPNRCRRRRKSPQLRGSSQQLCTIPPTEYSGGEGGGSSFWTISIPFDGELTGPPPPTSVHHS